MKKLNFSDKIMLYNLILTVPIYFGILLPLSVCYNKVYIMAIAMFLQNLFVWSFIVWYEVKHL